MKKGRAGLIFSISVGLTAILAASVSTYAWFVAESNASVEAVSDSAEITVAAPDPVNVSNPEVYMYRGNPSGTSVTSTPYTTVSSVGLRTITDFYPGDQITFAIKVTATSGTISSGSMNLTYQAYHLLNREIYGDSSKVVTILSAINVSTGTSTDGSYPAAMTNKLTPAARGGIAKSSLTAVGSENKYKLTTPGTIPNAVNNASFGAATAYFFFTILFSNVETTYYKEVTSKNGEVYNTPGDYTSDSSAVTRYFTGSNSGSSSCYEGLNFNITAANITVA